MAGAPQFTEQDTHRFTDEARRIIAFARVMDWTVRWANSSKSLAVLHSPVANKSINIPTTNVNYKRAKSWVKQLLTYSDPTTALNLLEGGFDMVREPDIASVVASYGTELSERVKQWREEDEMKRETVALARQTAVAAAMDDARALAERGRAAQEAVDTILKVVPDKAALPEEVMVLDGRRVVSIRPWLAKKGGKDGKGGTVYESKGVLQVTFEDGSETFKCKFCDRTNDNPRSVKMHAAQTHTRKRDKPEQEPTLLHTDHYQKSDITQPNRRAVAKLAHDLVMALDGIEAWQVMDAAELADMVARRVVENRPDTHGVAEPLTDEQVLRRIEALVDRGRVADLHQQVDTLSESLRVTAEARAAAEQEADKLRGERQALREMLAEES